MIHLTPGPTVSRNPFIMVGFLLVFSACTTDPRDSAGDPEYLLVLEDSIAFPSATLPILADFLPSEGRFLFFDEYNGRFMVYDKTSGKMDTIILSGSGPDKVHGARGAGFRGLGGFAWFDRNKIHRYSLKGEKEGVHFISPQLQSGFTSGGDISGFYLPVYVDDNKDEYFITWGGDGASPINRFTKWFWATDPVNNVEYNEGSFPENSNYTKGKVRLGQLSMTTVGDNLFVMFPHSNYICQYYLPELQLIKETPISFQNLSPAKPVSSIQGANVAVETYRNAFEGGFISSIGPIDPHRVGVVFLEGVKDESEFDWQRGVPIPRFELLDTYLKVFDFEKGSWSPDIPLPSKRLLPMGFFGDSKVVFKDNPEEDLTVEKYFIYQLNVRGK